MGNSAGTENINQNNSNKKQQLNNSKTNKKRKVTFANNLKQNKRNNFNTQILQKTNAKVRNGGIKQDLKRAQDKENAVDGKQTPLKPKPKPKRKVKRGDPPPPTPPKLTREDLLDDIDFTVIDEHALKAPNDLLLKSYWDLVNYLTDDNAWDDMCRVRSIYRWITSYNIRRLTIDITPPANSPLEYFSKIQCDMGNYANLFYILCQLADVPCVIIDGIAKSSGYRIGEKINKMRTKAQWNAVLVEGEWRLVDLFWALTCAELNSGDAKELRGKKNNRTNTSEGIVVANHNDDEVYSKPVIVDGREIVPDKGPKDNKLTEPGSNGKNVGTYNKNSGDTDNKNSSEKNKIKPSKIDIKRFRQIKHTEKVDDCYFFTNPRDLLWTHLPDDSNWQLVKEPLSFHEFENNVYVRERLYELGIEIIGKHNLPCKHQTKHGHVNLELKLPSRWASKLAFRHNFYRSKSTPYCKDEDDGALEHCIDWDVSGDRLYYNINIPVYGQFRLDIFGRNPLLKEVREFDLICSYIIYCPLPPKIIIPLPDEPEIGWGQNKDSDKAGLKPISHKKAKIGSDNGILEMKFHGPKNLNLSVRLKHRKIDEGTLSKYTLLRWHDGEYILNLRLPLDGYYALKLYGKSTEHGKMNLLNYLVRCKQNKIVKDNPFPILTQNMLGESVLAKTLGIRVLDRESGFITANKGRGKMHFCVNGEEQLLYEIHSNDEEAMKRVNMIAKKEHGIDSVHYFLPVAGEYVLSVYTHKENDINKLYTVYTSLIHSTGSIDDSVFTPRGTIGDNKGFWHGNHNIKTETIAATEKEVYIPYPQSEFNVVAYIDTSQGNGPQKNTGIEKIRVDEETLFKISLPDLKYSIVNIYVKNGGYLIKTIYRYFIIPNTEVSNEGENNEDEFQIFSMPSAEEKLDKAEIVEQRNEFMKKKMREAEFYKDPEVLNNLLAKLEENDDSLDDVMIKNVKKLAQKLEARQALLNAYESRNIPDVEKAIAMAHIADTDSSLKFEIMHATRLLNRLKFIHKIRETIVDADGRAIGESRKYANPPLAVKHSIMATLVLLGFPYYVVEDWTATQSILWRMDEDSIQNKMARFDPRTTPLEFALDAKMIIEQYTLDYMKTVSPLGTAFYVWATHMIEEIESTAGTLGGYSEVYHDNEVQFGNCSDSNGTSNEEPVVTGIDSHSDGSDLPPVNNPPADSHMTINNQKNQKQSVTVISVGSIPNLNDETTNQ